MNVIKLLVLILSLFMCFQISFAISETHVVKDVDCMANTLTLGFYNYTDHDNLTSFYNYDEIAVNDTLKFKGMDGKFAIYDGPFELNTTLLIEKTFDNDNLITIDMGTQTVFKVFFNPSDNFTTIDEIYVIDDCSPENLAKLYPPKYNLSFTLANVGINVDLKNANREEQGDLSSFSITPGDFGVTNLENNIKSFTISSTDINFTNMNLKIDVVFDSNNEILIYNYDKETQKWSSFSDFSKGNNQIILNSVDFGVYGIVENYVEPEIVLVEEKINESIVEEVIVNEFENSEIQENESKSLLMPTILSILLIVVLVGGYFSMTQHENKKLAKVDNVREPEILDSYKQTYNKTKTYVQTYKKSFSKDQIYRSLKGVNIPDDVIDKVFLEEY